MNWEQEIKQKQDLIDITKKEIEKIKIDNRSSLLKPISEKYLNNVVMIDYENYMYVTKIHDDRHIKGISIYCYEDEFHIEHDGIEMIGDVMDVVPKEVLIDFINNQANKIIKLIS